MRYLRSLGVIFAFLFLFFGNTFVYPALANNSPDRNHSSLSVANQAPADGHSTISVTVTLQDSSGSPLSGDTVTFIDSSNSSAVFNPTSATLNSSGQTTFTITSTSNSTDNISITDTTSNVTLNNLGQVVFTANLSPTPIGQCPDSAPGGTPQFTSEAPDGLNKIVLTWADVPDPVSHYLLAYGIAPGSYIYGNPNVGGQGTTTYTVGSLATGTKYYFAIKAVNGCNPGSFSNEVSATAGIANTPTPMPTSTVPTPTSTTSTISDTSNQDAANSINTPTSILDIQQPTETPVPSPSTSSGPSTTKIIEYAVVCILALGIFGGFLYWGYLKDMRKPINPVDDQQIEEDEKPIE